MATGFWDSQGVLSTDFLRERHTVNYYSAAQYLPSSYYPIDYNNVPEKLHWEVLPHPPYSPDLSPCDFHLFGGLKEALGVSKFQDDDVAECVLEWLRDQQKIFYKSGIMKLPQRWEKCIDLEGEYVEKLSKNHIPTYCN
jgi:hypothetical protein